MQFIASLKTCFDGVNTPYEFKCNNYVYIISKKIYIIRPMVKKSKANSSVKVYTSGCTNLD